MFGSKAELGEWPHDPHVVLKQCLVVNGKREGLPNC